MNYKLEFSHQEVSVIIASLGELPAKDTYNLITKVRNEVVKQETEFKEPQIAKKEEEGKK